MQPNISTDPTVPTSRRLSEGMTAASLALLLGVAFPGPALAQIAAPITAEEVSEALGKGAGLDRDLRAFYAARNYRPIWITAAGPRPEARKLFEILESAELDGLESDKFRVRSIRDAFDDLAEESSPKRLARAEALLSNNFVAYVRALRRVKEPSLEFADPEARPPVPEEEEVLQAAVSAPSLAKYVAAHGWMHPLYGQLRNALAAAGPDALTASIMRLNLERLRVLPANPKGRHVVVDAAGARLFMYDGQRQVDSMKVIVGRAVTPTPMMAGVIRYATLNPYWNVPTDLVRDRIAPEILDAGPAYLRQHNYEVLSDWSLEASATDPTLVDWQAVSSGFRTVRVRQRPGANNGMGKVKFMFPNDKDIYLHDTPDKALFRTADRHYSAGCIRLEDAARFGRWLFGRTLRAKSRTPELREELPDPVPVYVTYLTAFPEAKRVAIREDSYGRDGLENGPSQQAALAGR
jgi:murein L,D-transpeptidase YcbB/YkuD